jgi:cyclophilin family peptidyl-prolyl cis-trans isomerase
VSKQAKRDRQRQNREARREYETQLARRRKLWKGIRTFAIIAVPILIVGVILSVTAGSDDEEPEASTKCANVDAPPAKTVTLPAPTDALDPNQQYVATVETTCGTIEIELAAQEDPISANNFVYLANEKFYDDLAFVRAATGFVVQAGSPTQSDDGGPGYTLQAAVPTAQPPYPEGTVAWAKTEAEPAGTVGSQFFIVTGDAGQLTPDYAVLGTVTKGLDVAKKIEKLAPAPDPTTGRRDGPLTRPVVIKKVTITTRGIVPPSTAPTTAVPPST